MDAPRERGNAYHEIFWTELKDELGTEGIAYEQIKLRFGEAVLDQIPSSCHGEIPTDTESTGWLADRLGFVKEVQTRLLGIGTNLYINTCSADLLELAAHQLVHDTFDDEKVHQLASQGFAVHTKSDCALERAQK